MSRRRRDRRRAPRQPRERRRHARAAAPAAPVEAVRRIVLLGYMCAGKSTVGKALARRLEWRLVDFDVEIERREGGATIAELVAREGEAGLRAREAALTVEAAATTGVVLAPGGGWITRPELLAELGPGTFAAWLRISPEETVRRLRADTIARPFRDQPDPLPRVAEMLAAREPLYRLADLSVPAEDRTPEEIAFEIEAVVRSRGIIHPSPA